MSVPIREWLDKLISTCARKDVDNQFTKNQTIEKNITIKNSEIDYTTPPTAVTTGTLSDIKFTDLRDGRIASIEAYRSLAEDLGIRLRVKDKYLGFRVSDENITTSYVDHPYEEGPNNQIATVKYVRDKIAEFDTLLNRFLDDFNRLDAFANAFDDILAELRAYISQIEKRIDNWPPDKDTTYSFALENGCLVIRANDGTTQVVDLSSMNASIASDVFAVGSTIIIAVGFEEHLDYGVIIPGGSRRGWCPDDGGGATSGIIQIPGTWVCCVGPGNSSNVRGGIIRRIA